MNLVNRLFAAALLVALLWVPPAAAADTDGDGRLDLVDVRSFDPDATGEAAYRDPIQDLDGVKQLTKLDSLFLNVEYVVSLQTGDFDGLNNLRRLSLAGQRRPSGSCVGLGSIEAGAFDEMANLNLLLIRCSLLKRLQAQAFRGLPRLEEFYLTGNLIATIEADAFHGLANLHHLDLSGNMITQLEPHSLTSLTNLRTLDIGQNRINTVKPGAFSSLPNLQRLELIQNRIGHIEAGAFEGLAQLQDLILITNQIATIEPDGFRGLDTLKTLRLENNQIEDITPEMFRGLANLERLDLSQNPIRSIHPAAFEELKNLRRLTLGVDEMTSLNGSLNSLTLLERFSAYGDGLRVEVGDFDGLASLRQLGVGANQPTLKRGLFSGLHALTRLSLDRNEIASIDGGVFEDLVNLERLDLGENNFASIERGIFEDLTNLQWLDLGKSNIASIEDDALKGLDNLRDFELRDNAMTELNLTGATFKSLIRCEDDEMGYWYRGFCIDQDVEHLILNHAELSASSLGVILGAARSATDVSLVGLALSDMPEASFDLGTLLSSETLNNVTVDQRWFRLHSHELMAFDDLPGKSVFVVPEPVSLSMLAIVACWLSAFRRKRTR